MCFSEKQPNLSKVWTHYQICCQRNVCDLYWISNNLFISRSYSAKDAVCCEHGHHMKSAVSLQITKTNKGRDSKVMMPSLHTQWSFYCDWQSCLKDPFGVRARKVPCVLVNDTQLGLSLLFCLPGFKQLLKLCICGLSHHLLFKYSPLTMTTRDLTF